MQVLVGNSDALMVELSSKCPDRPSSVQSESAGEVVQRQSESAGEVVQRQSESAVNRLILEIPARADEVDEVVEVICARVDSS